MDSNVVWSKEATDYLMIASSIATCIALACTAYQIRQSRKASSANATAVIISNIRTAMDSLFVHIEREQAYYGTCILLNELELACAVYFDGQLTGNTREITLELVKATLKLIEENPVLLECAGRAVEKDDTFKFVMKFARKYKSDWQAIAHEAPSLPTYSTS